MSTEQNSARAPRPRRTLAQTLGSIVLGFEAVIVFLGGLVAYGLDALPDGMAPWWGVVGGSVLMVLLVFTAGMLRRRWGFTLGWVLQAIVALCAFVVPAMLVVALIFGGLWAYATIGGSRIDARNAALMAAHSDVNPTDPAQA